MIEQTCDLLGESPLRRVLAAALGTTPLPKPSDHHGGGATDMFVLLLRLDQVVSIEQVVARATTEGTTTAATRGRGIGGFVETWAEYRRCLEADGSMSMVADQTSDRRVEGSIDSNFMGKN